MEAKTTEKQSLININIDHKFLWGILILLVVGVSFASTTISDSYVNTTGQINASEFYVNDGLGNSSKLTKPYDVVVCRTADTGCDVVCTSDDCTGQFENAFNNYTTVLIKSGKYPVVSDANAEINIDANKKVKIDAYGAILTASTYHTGGKLLNIGNNSDVTINGITIDINKSSGVGIGSNSGNYNTKINLKDCNITNIYSYGIAQGGYDSEGSVLTSDSLTIDNCYFEAGSYDSLNEAILVKTNSYIYLRNIHVIGNKFLYVVSKRIDIDSFDGSSYGNYTAVQGNLIHGREIYLNNIVFFNNTLKIRPLISLHGLNQFDNLTVLNINNYRFNSSTDIGLYIEPYSFDYSMNNIYLSNLKFSRGEILIQPYSGKVNGSINNIIINNFETDGYTANQNILVDQDINIGNLLLQNVLAPTFGGNGAYMRVISQNNNVSISNFKFDNILAPSPTSLVRVGDNNNNRQANINIGSPFLTSITQVATKYGTINPIFTYNDYTYNGQYTFNNTLNMNNNIIQNIGNANTDFTSTGGLNLAGNLNLTSNNITNANIILNNAVSPFSCGASSAGAMFYNSSNNRFMGCNSTDWVYFNTSLT